MSTEEIDDEFIRLLTHHQSSLKAYIVSLMPGIPGVDDVLQEANVTLWRKREDFQIGSNFTAWSFAVARFSVLEYRRKARKSKLLVFSDDLSDELAFSPEEMAPDQEDLRRNALGQCLQRLSPNHRQLVDLRYSSQTSMEEFAKANGKSPGSLRVILHQVRANLRRCINSQLKTSPVE